MTPKDMTGENYIKDIVIISYKPLLTEILPLIRTRKSLLIIPRSRRRREHLLTLSGPNRLVCANDEINT